MVQYVIVNDSIEYKNDKKSVSYSIDME